MCHMARVTPNPYDATEKSLAHRALLEGLTDPPPISQHLLTAFFQKKEHEGQNDAKEWNYPAEFKPQLARLVFLMRVVEGEGKGADEYEKAANELLPPLEMMEVVSGELAVHFVFVYWQMSLRTSGVTTSQKSRAAVEVGPTPAVTGRSEQREPRSGALRGSAAPRHRG